MIEGQRVITGDKLSDLLGEHDKTDRDLVRYVCNGLQPYDANYRLVELFSEHNTWWQALTPLITRSFSVWDDLETEDDATEDTNIDNEEIKRYGMPWAEVDTAYRLAPAEFQGFIWSCMQMVGHRENLDPRWNFEDMLLSALATFQLCENVDRRAGLRDFVEYCKDLIRFKPLQVIWDWRAIIEFGYFLHRYSYDNHPVYEELKSHHDTDSMSLLAKMLLDCRFARTDLIAYINADNQSLAAIRNEIHTGHQSQVEPGPVGSNGARIDGWKVIAQHLQVRSENTAKKYHKERQMPVYSMPGSNRVFTWSNEIDAWLVKDSKRKRARK